MALYRGEGVRVRMARSAKCASEPRAAPPGARPNSNAVAERPRPQAPGGLLAVFLVLAASCGLQPAFADAPLADGAPCAREAWTWTARDGAFSAADDFDRVPAAYRGAARKECLRPLACYSRGTFVGALGATSARCSDADEEDSVE